MSQLRRAEDRADFLAAHLLVRHCVASLAGVATSAITVVQRCAVCGGPHGRPEVAGHPEITASLSHAHGIVAAAAGLGPLGVDVEALPGAAGLTTAELVDVLTPAEAVLIDSAPDPGRALLRQWVRKEAFLKAGVVDWEDLPGFDLSPLPAGEPAGHLALRSSSRGIWAVHDWSDQHSPAVGALVTPVGVSVTLTAP
jgi:4'-phosphopantetheinyl transferase